MDDFQDKVALVTGAASGIRLATASAFAAVGASVVLADRDEAALAGALEQLDRGDRAISVTCDVTQEDAVAAMIARAVEAFGRLDIAYNNAGIHVPVSDTADASTADFDRLMAVNLRGMWLCMKHELRRMREQESGVIVNCSSQSGISAAPGLGRSTNRRPKCPSPMHSPLNPKASSRRCLSDLTPARSAQ